jgi:hypothetical protein
VMLWVVETSLEKLICEITGAERAAMAALRLSGTRSYSKRILNLILSI